MRVLAIVQARMGSSRLPGKVLLEAVDKPLIVLMLERVRRARRLDDICLATSRGASDDVLASVVAEAGFRVFRGSEDDVLERFHAAASNTPAEVVVRLTGDCPLHDPAIIDQVVEAFLGSVPSCSYASNVFPPSYPDGLDVEVFSREALACSARTSTHPLAREHVTFDIHRQHGDAELRPQILNVSAPADFSHLRWTLDHLEDYALIKEIFTTLYPLNRAFSWLDVVALLTRRPELLSLNARHLRNASYMASLDSANSAGSRSGG